MQGLLDYLYTLDSLNLSSAGVGVSATMTLQIEITTGMS